MSGWTDVPTLTAASFDPKTFPENAGAGKRILNIPKGRHVFSQCEAAFPRLRRRPDGARSVQARIHWMTEPVPNLTVGDLKTELSRWSDETPVTFHSPLKEQEFRFYRYSPGENLLVLEINEFPETSPAVVPGA
jgi:hypothetical protein